MMRSMYSGVSGLKNHQARMDVIGNNIANVNTIGYKKSRLIFKDTLYQSIRGASGPTGTRGGTNAMAVGLGMKVGTVDQIMTAAPATITNKLTDMAIDGNGFFILDNGGTKTYTRAGAFDFDKNGSMVNSSDGYFVQGWNADVNGVIDATSEPGSIDISARKTVAPVQTSQVDWTGNLNSAATQLPFPTGTDPANWKSISNTKEYYDTLGNKNSLYMRYDKVDVRDNVTIGGATPTMNGTIWRVRVSTDATMPNPTAANNASNDYYLFFDESGALVRARADNGTPGATPALWAPPATLPNPPAPGTMAFLVTDLPTQNLTLTHVNQGIPTTQTISLNFGQMTQYEGANTAWAKSQNGNGQGDLTSYSIGIDGVIQGVYNNGKVMNLGRVALATFENPAGLIETGSNQYQVSNNSGDAKFGPPGEQGMGAIIPGSLEMANVDLSEEFTDMITTQRGFQANSRIITTSDEMLQELVNLKR